MTDPADTVDVQPEAILTKPLDPVRDAIKAQKEAEKIAKARVKAFDKTELT